MTLEQRHARVLRSVESVEAFIARKRRDEAEQRAARRMLIVALLCLTGGLALLLVGVPAVW